MKRLWLGVGVITALLCCGVWISARSEKVHGSISAQLEQATRAALAEDWPAVAAITEQTHGYWEENLGFSAAINEHTLLDEVEAGFAQLEVYLQRRQATKYAAACAALACRVRVLEEAHRLSWNNFL